MLSTRKINRKIKVVKNLKKITRAMEMVSAAKLRKVQTRLNTVRPYVNKLQGIMTNLIPSLNPKLAQHPFLARTTHTVSADSSNSLTSRPIMTVVITSDKGLCGSYNNTVIRAALQFMNQPQWSSIKIIALGRKAADYFTKHGSDTMELVLSRNRLPVDLEPKYLEPIINQITQSYLDKQVSEVWLVYADFINAMTYKPTTLSLLPISPSTTTQNNNRTIKGTNTTVQNNQLSYGYLFEPEATTILNNLLPKYLELLFYNRILSALASEQSARMTAMRNATENANEVDKELKQTFNKARQYGITKELLEIISGAEAMKG